MKIKKKNQIFFFMIFTFFTTFMSIFMLSHAEQL